MRIETLPLIVGALIALFGLALVLDARLPDRAPRLERRRRTRRERHRGGELVIGLGVIAMGAAVAGRDTWRYSILATLVGAALVLLGTWMNRGYLRDLLANRGPSRRRDESVQGTPAPGAPDSTQTPDKRPRVR
jgi:hypothetical protein